MEETQKKAPEGQETHVGLAVVLVFLLLTWSYEERRFLGAGIIALILVMAWPKFWKPLLPLWKGLLKLLEKTVSKAIFFLIFALIIVPIGIIRCLAGVDPLLLKAWKKKTDSVFVSRQHTFIASDITQPY